MLDLYCGTGTITLCLARHAKKAVGVEIIPQAIEDAKFNAAQNGMDNAEFYCMDAGAAAKLLAERGEKPDVIVVDPPRKGVSADVIEAIAAMQPQRVVYVSCDPATLARDVKLLTEKATPSAPPKRSIFSQNARILRRLSYYPNFRII